MLIKIIITKLTKLILNIFSSKQLYNMYLIKQVEETTNNIKNYEKLNKIIITNKLISNSYQDYKSQPKICQRN